MRVLCAVCLCCFLHPLQVDDVLNTYAMYSDVRSILASKRMCRSCIGHVRRIAHHMEVDRISCPRSQDYSDICPIRIHHSVHSPNYKQLQAKKGREEKLKWVRIWWGFYDLTLNARKCNDVSRMKIQFRKMRKRKAKRLKWKHAEKHFRHFFLSN